MSKQQGSVGEFASVCMIFLMTCILMLRFFDLMNLMFDKSEINQLARKYILRMETTGYLEAADESSLMSELQVAGATEVSLQGTTRNPVPYGETIALVIRGKVGDSYEFEEYRISTAKN